MPSLKHTNPVTRLNRLTFVWNAFLARLQFGLKGKDNGDQPEGAMIRAKVRSAVPPIPPEETLSKQELHNFLTAKAADIYKESLKNSFIPTISIYDDSFLLSCCLDQNLTSHAQLLYDCNQKIFDDRITPNLHHVKINLEDFFCSCSKGMANETQIIGICGDAGSGKTALMHVILKKIVEEGLYNVEFVFYVCIQDVDFKKAMSLIEFLLCSFKCGWILDQNWNHDFLNHLKKSHNVMILIDGLDEMSFEMSPWRMDDGNLSGSSLVLPHIYIQNILNGKLLPNARIILTSRPDKSYYSFLSDISRPILFVSIHGITKDCQQAICNSVCGEFQARSFDHISSNKNTLALCFSPLFCTLIAYCMYIQLKLNVEVDNFDSRTKVFVVLLEVLIEHSQSFTYTVLKQLCNLAWEKISSAHTFEVDCYEKKGFAFACSFFDGFQIMNQTNKNKFMKHLMLEEFFAALKLFSEASPDQLQKNVADVPCTRFQSVAEFVFSFHNLSVYERLSKLCPFLHQSDSNYVETCDLRKSKFIENLHYGFFNPSCLSDILLCSKWVYETQDKVFAKACGRNFDSKLLINGKIIPFDYIPLHYWFQARKMTKLEVTIYDVEFLGNTVVQLFENLGLMGTYIKVCTKIILIDSWKFSDQDMAFPKSLMSIELLSISQCRLDLSQILVLSRQLQHCHYLQEFDISCIIVDDIAASVLSYCIQHLNNLKKLYISSYCLSSSGMNCLCDAISCKSIPLKQLCFSNVTTQNLYSFSCQLCAEKEFIDCGLDSVKEKRFL